MPLCDGCGAPVDESHVRSRIERLEQATRFRPIHIQALLLAAAPPLEPQDDFYRAPRSASRSAASQTFFDQLAKCIGRKPGDATEEESLLAEFQRRGFYLAYAVECPSESFAPLAAAITKLAPRVLLRVNTSYKPKFVVPISPALQPLIALFQANSWADRLILQNGAPFADPSFGDSVSKALASHS
jgi:hypothetical protein